MTTTPETSAPQPEALENAQPASPRKGRVAAIAGALLALAAWVFMFWNGEISFFISIPAFIASIFGLRGSLKNLAITALIASSVLMLVFAIFQGAIYYLLKTM